jgi:hypothetical protein
MDGRLLKQETVKEMLVASDGYGLGIDQWGTPAKAASTTAMPVTLQDTERWR